MMQSVHRAREDFGGFLQSMGEAPDWSEIVLVGDGHYTGRRFRNEWFTGTWIAASNRLTIHDGDGDEIEFRDAAHPFRRAA